MPSGWAPLALVRHLACVELSWLRWAFTAEQHTGHLDIAREFADEVVGE